MTLRLVALMCIVLLLSLAAVGLLMNYYQQRFMREVQATAADVGQATLRTLEWTGWRDVLPGAASGEAAPGAADGARDAPAGKGEMHRIARVRHVITTSTEDNAFTVKEQLVYPTDGFPQVLPGEALEDQFEACLAARLEGQAAKAHQFMINVEAVRAERDAAGGLILALPRKMRSPDAPGSEPHAAPDAPQGPGGMARPADALEARGDEIRVAIGGNYEKLFANLRNRSLGLFLGVFVVGMVLSTALASRFTQPIRKLDAGIKRLAEGDLDVEVEARGHDEIGRLARTFNDMAKRARANREREREMVRREKLSALGRLAAGIAHDVRNPLHSIGLTLQHLSDVGRPEAAERQAEFDHSLGVIREEIRRLDQLVGNFLHFATSERRERRAVDLAELARDTLRLVAKEAERRGVSVTLEAPHAAMQVPADAEGIRSAVLNLILNALEAMPRGGELSLILEAAGDALSLTVADTGEGIPEEDRERVFEFAYTTREGGTGLGLAMVHHCIVEEHGGQIALDSRPGQGTRVRLTLPIQGGKVA